MTGPSDVSWVEPTQARSREKVARILRAAGDALVQGGLSNLKMTEIAKSAGVSVGTLYQYFPSDTALVAKLFADEMAPIDDTFRTLLREAASADDLMRSIEDLLDLHLSILRARPVLLTLWRSTGQHPAIQLADIENTRQNAAALSEGLATFLSDQVTRESREALAMMVCQLWGGFVQLAVQSDAPDADLLKAHFSGMLASYAKDLTRQSHLD